jgi:dTDP-4-dehydrorhamnose 3,5-epimerase
MPLKLEGAFIVELEPREDERGSFARVWCREELVANRLEPELAQCSVSHNPLAGTLRGMHFQRAPHEETKVVRCTRGSIFDVIVDLRPDSPTYTAWFGATLDAEHGTAMYVPKGFAHGFQTLVDDTDVLYMISHPYAPEAASGIRWDDPAVAIDWPDIGHRTIGARDLTWPDVASTARGVPGQVA